MTLLFYDGMDLYGLTAELSRRYELVHGSIGLLTTGGRFGGGCVRATADDNYITKDVDGNPAEAVISAAVWRANATASGDLTVRFNNDVANGLINFLSINSSDVINVRRGSTVLDSFTITLNVWHWISVRILAHASAGTVDIELDGTNVVSLSGIDTINSGAVAEVRSVGLGGDNNQNWRWDDLIITDVAGGAPFNDILADRRIDTILPNATGDSADFTASPAVDNNLNVDDVAPDDDTTYVESLTSTDLDLYNMESMGITPSTIDAVSVVALARNPDGGVTEFKLKTKTGTTEGTGASQLPLTNYEYFFEFFLVDPDTAVAWTESGVNAMQAGYEIT